MCLIFKQCICSFTKTNFIYMQNIKNHIATGIFYRSVCVCLCVAGLYRTNTAGKHNGLADNFFSLKKKRLYLFCKDVKNENVSMSKQITHSD